MGMKPKSSMRDLAVVQREFSRDLDSRLVAVQRELAMLSAAITPLRRPYFYLGGNWALTQLSTGHLFYVNTDDRQITPWIISGGSWENFVDDIIWEYIQPGMTVIDIGANLGYYTIKMGLKVGPNGRVFSFEPNPQLVPFIAQNIAINGFDSRCTLFATAVGDRIGKSELVVNAGCLGGAQMKELWGAEVLVLKSRWTLSTTDFRRSSELTSSRLMQRVTSR